MAAACDLPQWHIASSNGSRDFPSGVTAYTTRGGVSACTVRSTIPVPRRSRSCWESVRCVIPGIARFNSENRLTPWRSCSRTAAFQRPPTIRAVVSTGQSSGPLIIMQFHIVYHVSHTCNVSLCNHTRLPFIYLDHGELRAGFRSSTVVFRGHSLQPGIKKRRQRPGGNSCNCNWIQRRYGALRTTPR
jgi:hypothetical protein